MEDLYDELEDPTQNIEELYDELEDPTKDVETTRSDDIKYKVGSPSVAVHKINEVIVGGVGGMVGVK